MEKIRALELAPFSALLNMIKCNYLEKAEIYKTLLAVLCDYDPADEDNKQRTIHYIEILLSDSADLAMCLVSFLPTFNQDNRSPSRKDLRKYSNTKKSRQKKKKRKRHYHHKLSKHQVSSPKGRRHIPASSRPSPPASVPPKSFKVLDPCMYNAVKKEIKTPDQGSPESESDNSILSDCDAEPDSHTYQTGNQSNSLPSYVSSNTSTCSVTPSYKIPMVTPICQMYPSGNKVRQPVTTTTVGEPLHSSSCSKNKDIFPVAQSAVAMTTVSATSKNPFFSSNALKSAAREAFGQTTNFPNLFVPGRFEEPVSLPFHPHLTTRNVAPSPLTPKNIPLSPVSIYNFQNSGKGPAKQQSENNLYLPLAPESLPLPQPHILSMIFDESNRCQDSTSAVPGQFAQPPNEDSGHIKMPLAGETVPPVYLGTSSNLSAFPYTHQIVLPDGHMQNMFLKRAGVDVPNNYFNLEPMKKLSSSGGMLLNGPHLVGVKSMETNQSCGTHTSHDHETFPTAANDKLRDQCAFDPKNILQGRSHFGNMPRVLPSGDHISVPGLKLDPVLPDYEVNGIPFLIKHDAENMKKKRKLGNLLEGSSTQGHIHVSQHATLVNFSGNLSENRQKPKKVAMSSNQEVRKKLFLTPAVPNR